MQLKKVRFSEEGHTRPTVPVGVPSPSDHSKKDRGRAGHRPVWELHTLLSTYGVTEDALAATAATGRLPASPTSTGRLSAEAGEGRSVLLGETNRANCMQRASDLESEAMSVTDPGQRAMLHSQWAELQQVS